MSTLHIVGAGVAGLAAAVRLRKGDRRIILHESAGQAGGRCRSLFEKSMERTIDNGNHLLLSGNSAVHSYLSEIGAEDELDGPATAEIPFLDLASDERWTIRVNRGRLPWWIFSADRRPPDTTAFDFLSARRLAKAEPDETVADCLDTTKPIYRRFWEPLAVAVLNTPAEKGSADLLWAAMRESFARGGGACAPRIARTGLSSTFVDPALETLHRDGVEIRFNDRLRGIESTDDRIRRLYFTDSGIELTPEDILLLAVPAPVAGELLPDLETPRESHAIVNVHFRLAPAQRSTSLPFFLGLVGGAAQWLFFRDDVVSVTVSAADELAEQSNSQIAALVWPEVAHALGRPADPCPEHHRVIKERRATFSQTPAAVARRPGPATRLANLFIAGDWTDTGLPATIEGAIRSGHTAASRISTF
jgi:squalene-associated FAD-dependent desaturase